MLFRNCGSRIYVLLFVDRVLESTWIVLEISVCTAFQYVATGYYYTWLWTRLRTLIHSYIGCSAFYLSPVWWINRWIWNGTTISMLQRANFRNREIKYSCKYNIHACMLLFILSLNYGLFLQFYIFMDTIEKMEPKYALIL